MTKRPSIRRTHAEDQADLFGGAAPPAQTLKKAHAAGRPSASFAKPAKTQLHSHQSGHAFDALLNVRQAAVRLGLSKSTLDKMRAAGKGPRFIKSTDRAVRYDPADLDAWIALRRSTLTSRD